MGIIEKFKDFQYDLPIKFGQNKIEILDLIGKPDKETFYDSYSRYGFVLGYNIFDELDLIWAMTMESGITYKGKIFGVNIGDSIAKSYELWGKENSMNDKRMGYYTSVWYFDKLTIEVEHWNEDGNEEGFGQYYSGNIKEIQIRIDDENPEKIF